MEPRINESESECQTKWIVFDRLQLCDIPQHNELEYEFQKIIYILIN